MNAAMLTIIIPAYVGIGFSVRRALKLGAAALS